VFSYIDINAAARGWFVEKYEGRRTKDGVDLTIPRYVSSIPRDPFRIPNLMDLLAHEMGDVFGRDSSNEGDVIDESLPPSTRRVWGDDSLLDDLADFSAKFAAAGLTPATIDRFFAGE
jgi:hypothetical protein